MSIGGFGVIASRQIRVASDQLACLKARGLDYIVKVTHQKPTDDGVYIGLKQVEEVLQANSIYPKSPRWVTTAAWATAAGAVAAVIYCLFTPR